MARKTLIERLATLSREEILAQARAAAWGDKHDPRVAEQIAQFDDDRAEVMAIWEENQEAMAKATEELLELHPELRRFTTG